MASTASGPLAPMTSAMARAFSRAVPSGTTRPIRPISLASWADTSRAVSRRSMATVKGIWRRSRTVDPPRGNRPRRASNTPNLALSPATRMSVAWRISVPPATAQPSTAAMSGFLSE